MSIFDQFTNQYKISKTLRFSLIPQGKTLENIQEKKLLEEDEERAEDFKKAKKIIDEYHKWYIDKKLEDFKFEVESSEGSEKKSLQDYADIEEEQYKSKKKTKEISKKIKSVQKNLREQIEDKFLGKKEKDKDKSRKLKKYLFGEDFLRKYLISWMESEQYVKEGKNEEIEVIKKFKKWVTYFKGFEENRKNVYTNEDIPTSITHRIVHVNLPIILKNIRKYEDSKKIGIDFKEVETLLKDSTIKLDDVFKLDYYNKCLKQRDIEEYNLILGGKTEKDGKKIKGVNECINLYSQRLNDKAESKATRKLKMEMLQKQILSDTESRSFLFSKIENDEQLLNLLSIFKVKDDDLLCENEDGSEYNISCELKKVLSKLKDADMDGIFIKSHDEFRRLSSYLLKDRFKIKSDFEEKKKEFNWEKMKHISLKEILDTVKDSSIENGIYQYYENLIIEMGGKEVDLIENIKETHREVLPIINNRNEGSKGIRTDKEKIEKIKLYVESILWLQRFLKDIHIPRDDRAGYNMDSGFYVDFDYLYDKLNYINNIYNQTRNYLTQKHYSILKYKINFQKNTLLTGWGKQPTEYTYQYSATILMRKDEYFLGIISRDNPKIFQNYIDEESQENYQLMNYSQNPFDKTISRIPEYKKNKDEYKKNYKKLIDFVKNEIEIDDKYKVYNFDFKNTDEYDTFEEFKEEFNQSTYQISFDRNISKKYIDNCVNDGKLYLFKIYNKDLSQKSRGKPNLHTIYWKAVFSEENRNLGVYKLDGGAELFYRKASINYSENMWEKGHHHDDPGKRQHYPIIKDKRYAENKFFLHVPITLNRGKKVNFRDFNNSVKETLVDNIKNVRFLGIDRGERNLAYYSLIDHTGKLLSQGSLNNPLGNKDYQALLHEKEKERDNARKSWKTIENIKELKFGYLSQVVHKITKLMIENNAIVIFEDLNKGFKRGRIKVEKQVYQKFEKMLLEKLNYLVFKNRTPDNPGGFYKAYQLTLPFTKFEDLKNQTGFIFYVNPYHTSKICPATGFVDLFKISYKSIEDSKKIIKNFDKICFNESMNYFEFHFKYTNFGIKLPVSLGRRYWVACTRGERLIYSKDVEDKKWKPKEIDLTNEFIQLFNKYRIVFSGEDCLKEKISLQNDKDFFYRFLQLFKNTLQMRNSLIGSEEDWIISPFKDKNGNFFDSRINPTGSLLPNDGDSNGAYHIALKGLLMLKRLEESGDVKFIKNDEWYEFIQKLRMDGNLPSN